MKKIQNDIELYRNDILFGRREHSQRHMSYIHEQIRHNVIKEGRIDMLEQALQTPPDGTFGVLSKNALRSQKNMFIASITGFTRYAIEGGLQEELAFAMSDSYIMKVEDCNSIAEIDNLYNHAFREFTYAVAQEGNQHYTSQIEAAIHYITIHLHEKITLESTADAIGISSGHLSRIFKKETGISIVDYVQKERVKAAKNLLIYSDSTLTEISQYLHFSTQSYFISIFKKHFGITPGQYRKHYKENGSW